MADRATPGDDPVAGEVALDSTQGRLLITTVVLGSAVAMLTATVVNVALPTLARSLDAGSSGQKWIVNGYTLTLAALVLPPWILPTNSLALMPLPFSLSLTPVVAALPDRKMREL